MNLRHMEVFHAIMRTGSVTGAAKTFATSATHGGWMAVETPTGRLVFHILGAIDEFQRELIVEGTREGLDAARARGRSGGRRPKLSAAKAATVRRMYQATGPDGKRLHTVAEIAQTAGVHRTTVYDYLKKES